MFEKFVEGNDFILFCMIYNFIIDGFIKEGILDFVLSVYIEMRDKGVFLNVIIYIILIDGFCKSNNIDFVLNVRNEMISNDF